MSPAYSWHIRKNLVDMDARWLKPELDAGDVPRIDELILNNRLLYNLICNLYGSSSQLHWCRKESSNLFPNPK